MTFSPFQAGGGPDAAPSSHSDIALLDAHDQYRLIAQGVVCATDLVEGAIDRIERLNPSLNAISHRAFDAARAAARQGVQGPMGGVPVLVKDSMPYRDMPSCFGSRFLAGAGPDLYQHDFADRMDAAGFIALGKTTVPEFSLLPTTESALLGDSRNPWDTGRSCGGSSGGSAVAVASGMVPMAHAADGGGSIRIPASCCGLVGFKPSRGANVRARNFHLLEDILVSDAMLARSVRDAAWSAQWMCPPGKWPRAKSAPLRIAYCLRDLNGAMPHPDVAHVVEKSALLCEELGHELVPLDHLPGDLEIALPTFRILWQALTLDGVEHLRRSARGAELEHELEPWALGLADQARRMSASQLAEAYGALSVITRTSEALFEDFDVLLSPVVRDPPPLIGHLASSRGFDALEQDMFAYIGYTPLQNMAGQPSISLPLFTGAGGLPIGSMFSAASGGDALLLGLAAQLEQAMPWRDRWPPLALRG